MLRDLFKKNDRQLEETEKAQKKLFQTLLERAKELDAERERMCEELELTPEQIKEIVENQEIFTEEQWKEIKSHFEATILEETDNTYRSPAQIQQARQGLAQIQHNWIPVR